MSWKEEMKNITTLKMVDERISLIATKEIWKRFYVKVHLGNQGSTKNHSKVNLVKSNTRQLLLSAIYKKLLQYTC